MLDDIVASVRNRLPGVIARRADFETAAADHRPRGFGDALRTPGLSVIAEIKRRSPSAGAINEELDPAALAGSYESGGAAALSVLTEPDHFGAQEGDLGAARDAVAIPVLRKDFTIDPSQVWQAAAMGADAILLIVAILEQGRLEALLAEAGVAGLDVLVEAHAEDEVRRAVDAGATIVGVNNRDLRTFQVDLATAERFRPLIPDGTVTVAESGVKTPADARRMADAGYDAVLVGEAAAKSGDPAGFVRSLRGGV